MMQATVESPSWASKEFVNAIPMERNQKREYESVYCVVGETITPREGAW